MRLSSCISLQQCSACIVRASCFLPPRKKCYQQCSGSMEPQQQKRPVSSLPGRSPADGKAAAGSNEASPSIPRPAGVGKRTSDLGPSISGTVSFQCKDTLKNNNIDVMTKQLRTNGCLLNAMVLLVYTFQCNDKLLGHQGRCYKEKLLYNLLALSSFICLLVSIAGHAK